MQPPLVLASTSIIRQKILSRLNIPFCVMGSEVDETVLLDETPIDLVTRLSQAKAQSKKVREKYPNGIIIGCDQVAECDDQILGKPLDEQTAFEQLKLCSGKCVTFYSGICLFNAANGVSHVRVDFTDVVYRELSASLITCYLELAEPYQCAGSLRSEFVDVPITAKITSDSHDPYSLLGLPLRRCIELLKKEASCLWGEDRSFPDIFLNTKRSEFR